MPSDIVLLTQVFPPAVGGSGVLLDNVYRRISGVQVTVIVDAQTCGDQEVDRAHMKIVRATIDKSQWGMMDPRGWPGHLNLARVVRRQSRRSRTVVHCGRALPEGIAAMLAGWLPGGPPYVFWAHGEDITTAKSSMQYARALRRVYKGAAGAIANCEHTAALLRDEGMPEDRIAVIYPGVDTNRFRSLPDHAAFRRMIAAPHEPILLTVGRLQTRKGHDLVMRALPRIKRSRPGVRYVIVGDGVERERLERLSLDLDVSDIVQFAGEVPEDQLPRYFDACDVFVMPTRVDGPDFEGFGIVFLEAAAAGKPTIGGRNGGVPEAIDDGVTGLVVSGTDVDEFAASVERLLGSDQLRHSMGEAGRQRVKTDFTWDVASAALRSFHDRIAASTGGQQVATLAT